MANKRYNVDECVDVTISVKVKLDSISNYHPLTDSEIIEEFESAKKNLADFLVSELRKMNFQHSSLTDGVDYWNFEII